MCENSNRVTKLTSTHRSVDGKKLWLDIISHDSSNLCFEFTVKNVSVFFTGKKFVFSVFVIVSLLAALDIHNPNLYVVVVLIFVIGRLIAELLWSVNSESVLLVAPVGLQLTATYQFGRQTSQFIPWHFITDVIINEAITLHRVVYYLAVLLEQPYHETTRKKLIPLFQHTRPRLACLEMIYQRIQRGAAFPEVSSQ
ncbi:phosphatidylinositol N-acetylglucosaminyltransferase subunit H-like [Cryptotermes secundus]|uniref:phosphatidylinositol N-acetylglucosaminyltransferase subunit H-like n=1 Tax=Cryptotermes secundus TaxID=105785 RepID=UPI000CD7C8DD|nr:phosphatidylinositol N-acetylglucosaminyltransferase subunit H-like [Cryptotermes secundus]